MELTFTKNNFEELVLNADKPVLVDFWAPWCMPCRMLAPTIEEIAEEAEGKAYVGKVNVDEEAELAIKYGVRSIPTLLFFEKGQLVNRMVGVQDKEDIVTALY
ncbi:MAG: thioredoxin [Clostridia bacterium]|nr:thioredoxin [Clostridia bacterium]MBR2053318.1 thioredoxin [Clostridia bacterium]MBR6752795.1 thioredoxin [Clostridia bacterium]